MYRSFNPRPIPLDKNRLRQLVDDLFSKWRQKLKKLRSADKSVGRRSNVSLDFELKSVKGIIKKGQLRLMGASKPTGSGKVTQWSSLFGLGAFFIGSAEQSRRYLGVKIDAVEKGRFLIALPFNNKWTPTKILHKMAQDPAFIEQQKHKLFSYMIHEISHAKDIFTHNKEKERYEDLYRLKGLRYKKRPIRPVRQPTGLYNLRGEKIYFTMTTKGGWQEILDRFPAAQVYKLKARGYGFKQIAESLSYYNEPWEVRAYMQQIVHEVNSYMQKAKKRGEENHFLMKDFEAAFSDLIFQTSFWPQMSKTWKDKEKWFTAQNKKYILDSIVQNLQESKLVPDRRKGKKPFKKKPKPTRAYRKPTKRPPILPLDQCMGLKMVANPVQMTEYSIQKDDTFGGVIIVKKVPLKPARFPWSKWEEVEHVDTVEQAKKKIARYYADEKKERQRKSDAEITRRQREALRSMDLFGMYEEELSKPPASLGTTSRGKKITTAFRRQSNVGAFTPMYSHHSSKDYAYFQQFFKSFTAGDHKEAAKAHREAEKDQKEAERGARNMASRYRGSPTGREWSLRRSLHDRMADHHVGMKQSHEAEAKGKGKGKIQQKLFNPSLKVGDKIQEGNRKGTVKSLRSKGTVDVLFDDMDYVIRRQLGSVKRINPRRKNKGQESQLEDIWYDWMIQGKKPALRKGYLSVRELEPFREYSRFELRNSPRTKHYRQLKENIAQRGVQEPIGLILGSNGHAYIGEGNHRHEIAKDLGITHLPVELHFWQEPTSNGGANWSAWYKEDGDVDENDLINEILTDLRLNPQNILIPPPPIEKKRIAELKKIQKQYKNRVVPDHLQKRLDEKVGDTFDDFLRSEGYRSQRAQIKKWNNGIIQQIMLHKNHYGAERPHQLAKRKGIPFQYDKLKTARTPSYPSGHTTQAYFLAMKLSQQHPELKGRLFNLANMVAESRIDRGVHFPSDNKAGMALAQQVFAGDTRKSNPFTPKEKKLIQKIQRVIETRPQLLKEPYRSKVQKGAHPHTGHCYVASQALYSLLGAKKAGYSPLCMQHEGGSHWAILREKDGAILDPTVAQFKTIPDYSKGVRKGYCHPKQKDKSGCFLPDARTRKLLGWMK